MIDGSKHILNLNHVGKHWNKRDDGSKLKHVALRSGKPGVLTKSRDGNKTLVHWDPGNVLHVRSKAPAGASRTIEMSAPIPAGASPKEALHALVHSRGTWTGDDDFVRFKPASKGRQVATGSRHASSVDGGDSADADGSDYLADLGCDGSDASDSSGDIGSDLGGADFGDFGDVQQPALQDAVRKTQAACGTGTKKKKPSPLCNADSRAVAAAASSLHSAKTNADTQCADSLQYSLSPDPNPIMAWYYAHECTVAINEQDAAKAAYLAALAAQAHDHCK